MSKSALQLRGEVWSGSENPLARAVARPMVKFLAQEAASGLILLVATAAALIWVNLPGGLGASYHEFWETHLVLGVGDWNILDKPLEKVVNDALMVLFFFVVGLEIKAELVTGDLKDRRVAALPAIAALGGMVVPALLFLVVVRNTGGAQGWGVPMATDIAFAVGVMALMGSRASQKLKLFLLTLAIVDDIGAILVIAIFYTQSISYEWLSLALGLLLLIVTLKSFRVWYTPIYVVIGVIIWYATFRSGVHATLAGVVLGLLTPAKPLLGERAFENVEDVFSGDTADPATLRDASWKMRESVATTTRLTQLLSPWTGFLIVPIFALSNAGIKISGSSLSTAATSPVTLGIIVGLVIGKPLGVAAFSWLALRMKWATMPKGMTQREILGGGAIAGIGFTVALFISNLAYVDELGKPLPALVDAKMGVLIASILATALGWLLLWRASASKLSATAEKSTPVLAKAES